MAQSAIRFINGAAYDQGMGKWSQIAGGAFLEFLAPRSGLRWLDVGCGSGAFTELVVQRCAPAGIDGIDPSDAQLAFARSRATVGTASFQSGDAMALPFETDRFDVAVMALVIFFVPDPAKGVAEMARVVRPGGTVAAYAWDMLGGGFPFHPIQAALRGRGYVPPLPPSVGADRLDALRELWTGAGLEAIETREIRAQRTFADFDDFWAMSTMTESIRPAVAALAPDALEDLKSEVRSRLGADTHSPFTYESRANAIKGCVPG